MQSLARNHAFVDGNKRMAFALTAVFLRLNGCSLSVGTEAGEHFVVRRVIEGQAELDEIADWIEHHLKAR
jgi:death-on-curing protein